MPLTAVRHPSSVLPNRAETIPFPSCLRNDIMNRKNGARRRAAQRRMTMKYDFTSIIDRTGKDAIAVDIIPFPDASIQEGFSRIPMWVADMNFATAPTIQEAVIERTKHPAFGYFDPSDEYYNSIISWQKARNGVEGLSREHIGYENGVLGGLISALVTERGVLYPPFDLRARG